VAAGLKNNKVEKTLEFFPEEGKYHLSGHRKCGVSQTPDQTVRLGNRCPECGRPLTLGVVHRVEELSGAGTLPIEELNRPYSKLVPLVELVAHTMGRGRAAKSVGLAYQRICGELGGEVKVLTQVGYSDLERVGGENLAVAVIKVRNGQVQIVPGFDGQYGVVQPA
jgi:PHP family Zn ribbon phosphoesterase